MLGLASFQASVNAELNDQLCLRWFPVENGRSNVTRITYDSCSRSFFSMIREP